MKNKKTLIITGIIVVILSGFYLIFKPQYYSLHVKTDKTFYDYADGILVKDFWKGAFYLNVNFDDPNAHCSVGLFIKKGDNLKILEAFGGSADGNCSAIVTESGYSLTNKEFYRIEKNFKNGNIINQMLENKEQVYLCISDYDIDSITIDDCYKVEFDEK